MPTLDLLDLGLEIRVLGQFWIWKIWVFLTFEFGSSRFGQLRVLILFSGYYNAVIHFTKEVSHNTE
jgi:hypothetical protein